MPAMRLDLRHEVVVEVGDAVPQDVAGFSLHQERPLPDGEAGVGADADDLRPFFADPALVSGGAQLIQRRPLLPAPSDVLALVFADRALAPGRAVLDAAGSTDRQVREGSGGCTFHGDKSVRAG